MSAPLINPISFPPGIATPLGSARALQGVVPEISFTSADGVIFYLQGAKAPILSCEDGIGLLGMDGLQAPFSLLDEQGARQDGITNLDTVFDPAVLNLYLEASGRTPASLRQVVRTWMSAWNPPSVGTLTVFTPQMGHWWMPVRQRVTPDDMMNSLDPSLHRRWRFKWQCRGDNAFWQGVDSVSYQPGGLYPGAPQSSAGNLAGWLPLTNLGTRPAWPRFLCYGPGTFTIGNGAVISTQGNVTINPVQFGPLQEGQIACIYTDPRLRSVVDLSPGQPAQVETKFQQLIQTMVNMAAGNYPVPPDLVALESIFGILPPNGPLYSLLNGRFTGSSMIPGKKDGYPPATAFVPVWFTGGNSSTRIVGAITPYRTWPW